MPLKKIALAVVVLLTITTQSYNQPTPPSWPEEDPLTLEPHILSARGRVNRIWTNAYSSEPPSEIAYQASGIVAGMSASNEGTRTRCARAFLGLLETLPPDLYKIFTENKHFLKDGIRKALPLLASPLDSDDTLAKALQAIFDKIFADGELTLHEDLIEACLQALEDNPNLVRISKPLVIALKTCIECCNCYANGSPDNREFHSRIITRAVAFLSSFLEKFDFFSPKLPAAQALILLLQQAVHLRELALLQQVIKLGNDACQYGKLASFIDPEGRPEDALKKLATVEKAMLLAADLESRHSSSVMGEIESSDILRFE